MDEFLEVARWGTDQRSRRLNFRGISGLGGAKPGLRFDLHELYLLLQTSEFP